MKFSSPYTKERLKQQMNRRQKDCLWKQRTHYRLENGSKYKYKYLGVTFFYNGNLKHAADYLYNKGLKAMFLLKRKL